MCVWCTGVCEVCGVQVCVRCVVYRVCVPYKVSSLGCINHGVQIAATLNESQPPFFAYTDDAQL